VLGRKLEDAGSDSWDNAKTVSVDFAESEDKIIRFVIEPAKGSSIPKTKKKE
jgi:hypothetical protein